MPSMPTSGMPSKLADTALPENATALKPTCCAMRADKPSYTPGTRTSWRVRVSSRQAARTLSGLMGSSFGLGGQD